MDIRSHKKRPADDDGNRQTCKFCRRLSPDRQHGLNPHPCLPRDDAEGEDPEHGRDRAGQFLARPAAAAKKYCPNYAEAQAFFEAESTKVATQGRLHARYSVPLNEGGVVEVCLPTFCHIFHTNDKTARQVAHSEETDFVQKPGFKAVHLTPLQELYQGGLLPITAKKAADLKKLAMHLPAAQQQFYLALEDDGGDLSEEENADVLAIEDGGD